MSDERVELVSRWHVFAGLIYSRVGGGHRQRCLVFPFLTVVCDEEVSVGEHIEEPARAPRPEMFSPRRGARKRIR